MTGRKTKVASVLVVAGLAVAACGSDDGADDSSSDATTAEGSTDGAASDLDGTLRVLIHQNPAGVEFFESFNDQFEADNPGVEIDLSIVEADALSTTNQTRLTANDIDVTTISLTGFDKPVQDYMTDADPPPWQQLIDAGLIKDLSGEAFLDNYDEAAIDSSSYNDGVYAVALGRTTYSGMFVNDDLLAEVGVETPTAFDELVAACATIEEAGKKCMIAGGQDGWPVHVGTYGILGALYPDQEGLVEGLWTGEAKWNDEEGLELFEKYGTFASLLDAESAGLTGDSAASRFTVGDVAFGPMGGWNAGTIEDAEFGWSYVPFPGSDDAANNQTLYGKVDMSLAVAEDTPVPELASAYLTAFSDPDTYEAFANATGYIPTQPTAVLDNTLGESITPILQEGNFSIGLEQWMVLPKGAGQWANGWEAARWLYLGDFSDPVEAANQAQADWESGL
ncbi:MAG TPA: extracellular solute-binding protein [Ilumatobacteraceae bacterium]|nr:extracellular solute-binding protein [Ilumatobacteraceae bacterium]